MIWIINSSYVGDYKIEIEFNSKEKGVVDLESLVKERPFKELSDKNMFSHFSINNWTLEWKNGVDISPEYLFENLQRKYPV